VTGLPPTPEEVEVFVADSIRDAVAVRNLVDRLLASPRYGERSGRHWLDVVRFGESNGFERNFVIDDLWPFRDYVIKSINDDKPFNQFITEHLAGDVIGKDNPPVEVGSAFLVAQPYLGNQISSRRRTSAQQRWMIPSPRRRISRAHDQLRALPSSQIRSIPTEDYYRLRAAFEGITHGRRVVATKEQREAFTAAKPSRSMPA